MKWLSLPLREIMNNAILSLLKTACFAVPMFKEKLFSCSGRKWFVATKAIDAVTGPDPEWPDEEINFPPVNPFRL